MAALGTFSHRRAAKLFYLVVCGLLGVWVPAEVSPASAASAGSEAIPAEPGAGGAGQEELSLAAALAEARQQGPAFAALRRDVEMAALAERRQAAAGLPRVTFSASAGLGSLAIAMPSTPSTSLSLTVPDFEPHLAASLRLDWTLPGDWQLQASAGVESSGPRSSGALSVGIGRQWPSPAKEVEGGETEAARRERRNQAVLEVVEAWYAARSTEAEWTVRRELLAVAEWEYQAAWKRRDDGGGSLRELLAAEDALRQAQESERSAFARHLAAWQRLETLLGRPPGRLRPARWVDDLDWPAVEAAVQAELGVNAFPGEVVATASLLPGDLAERLLARSSSGLQAMEAVEEAERGVAAARAARGWRVGASASYGLDLQEGRVPVATWQTGITLAHPIHDPALALDEEAARLRLEEARRAVAGKQEELVQQVVDSWQRVQNAFRAIEDARLAAERSTTTRDVALARYEAGLVAWNDRRRAEIALVQAVNRRQAAEGEYRLALLRLADALGLDVDTVVGWEPGRELGRGSGWEPGRESGSE